MDTWNDRWRYLAGLAVCAVLGWFAFVRGTNVPILSLADLGVHELGHLLTYVFPDLVTAMMGSITQVLVPWALAGFFLAVRRDVFAATFCLAWAGTSAQNASVYIADAPYRALPLIGGEHDWDFVLGRLDVMERAADIANAVRWGGLILLLVGASLCLAGLLLETRAAARPQVPYRGLASPPRVL